MSLSRYILKRLLLVVPTVFFVIIFTFTLIHLAPGDPAAFIAGEQASAEYVASIRREYGFDKPITEQLITYLKKIIQGDFGYSYMEGSPASEIVLDRLPATLILVIPSLILSFILGVPFGIIAARKYPSHTSSFIGFFSTVLFSIPIFVFGLLMMIIFSIRLGWLPSTGMISAYGATGTKRLFDILEHLILPLITLTSVWGLPQFIRLTTSSVLEVSKEDYITTARAIGLNEKEVFNRHAFRNSILPVITMFGLRLSYVVAGATFTETVFTWPGIGRLLYDSIRWRDYTVLMYVFILTSVTVSIITLITDIICAFIDSRITYG
jgi:peptide/nickel transport system permease protein